MNLDSPSPDSTIGDPPHEPPVSIGSLHQWLEALASLLHSINSDVPMSNLLDSIAETACSLLKLDKCSVMLSDPLEQRLKVVGSAGLSQAYLDLVNGPRPISLSEQGPRYSSPSAQAYLTKSIVLIPSASDASEFSPWRDMALGEGYEALIAAPLEDEGHPLGVIVGYCSTRRMFPIEQIDSIRLLAKFAATALMTARLRADSRSMIDELHHANNELLAQQQVLAELDIQHDQLMRTVASNVGIPGVVTALAKLLRTPVCLQDIYGPVIAEERLHHQSFEFDIRDQLMAEAVYWDGHRVTAPQQLVNGEFTFRPITLDSNPVALLWVGPHPPDRTQPATLVLDRFALAVALELAKELPLRDARNASARDVVARLMSTDELESTQAAMSRAAGLGFDPNSRLHIALIECDTQAPRDSETNLLTLCERLLLQDEEFPSLIGGSHERVVILLGNPSANQCDSVLRKHLETLRRRVEFANIRSVITVAPEGLHQVHRLHRALTGSLKFLSFEHRDRLRRIDMLDSTGLLLTHGSPDTLSAFAQQTLKGLLNPDAGSTEQLQTLQMWIDSGCSTSITAQRMHLHPNTIKYRLNNIEKQLDMDLRGARALTDLRLALDVCRLMGLSGLSVKTNEGFKI